VLRAEKNFVLVSESVRTSDKEKLDRVSILLDDVAPWLPGAFAFRVWNAVETRSFATRAVYANASESSRAWFDFVAQSASQNAENARGTKGLSPEVS
jgi:hypothetical protein